MTSVDDPGDGAVEPIPCSPQNSFALSVEVPGDRDDMVCVLAQENSAQGRRMTRRDYHSIPGRQHLASDTEPIIGVGVSNQDDFVCVHLLSQAPIPWCGP
ncbi:hypothetical protein [Mycolicibacterium sp.]|uniref:hypothetical protein n=1 Tax=Mycolicibacterium sp. TaxID=2320850 RepID=UPI0025D43370|nr:hypothetical protein [Mycolicibacterium sp.]